MSASEFDGYFDNFQQTAFRLETLPAYAVDGDERFEAFRAGRALPERSVRTSPWLARMAVTTLAGKAWSRAHVVDHPLSEYLRYELSAYVESAVVGEVIGIADRAAHPDLAALRSDFWLFDADTAHAHVLLMRYTTDGRWLGFEHCADPEVLRRCRAERDLVWAYSMALNGYLAQRGTIVG